MDVGSLTSTTYTPTSDVQRNLVREVVIQLAIAIVKFVARAKPLRK
jgi:hypothetical protein